MGKILSEISVYKALDIPKLEAYLEKRIEAIELFNSKCKAFKEKIGHNSLHGFKTHNGGWIIEGYVKEKYREEIPVGWRLKNSRGSWEVVAAKRTPEGKVIQTELKELVLADVKYPGFPEIIWGNVHIYFPHLRRYNLSGEYYIVLSGTGDDSSVNRAQWEKISLAEFYSATEGKEYEDK